MTELGESNIALLTDALEGDSCPVMSAEPASSFGIAAFIPPHSASPYPLYISIIPFSLCLQPVLPHAHAASSAEPARLGAAQP